MEEGEEEDRGKREGKGFSESLIFFVSISRSHSLPFLSLYPLSLHPSLLPFLCILFSFFFFCAPVKSISHARSLSAWEWVSHRVCTNMQRAQFDRCHQRTSIWITRQPAIFEFTRNGINTWLRPKQQLNTTTTTWKSKQLGTGKGFIIYGLMNWLTKTQLTPPISKVKME